MDEAVDAMLEFDTSSLLVADTDGSVAGIVTKTDILEALTWKAEGNRAVEIYGTDLLDDITYYEIVGMIDGFDQKDAGMRVVDAKIHLHDHDEQLRGTPLLLARIRLATDLGHFIGTREADGARHAIDEPRDVI